MIVIAVLGLFACLHAPGAQSDMLRLDGGLLVLALAAIWYSRLDWRLGLPFAVILYGCYFLARSLPVSGLVSLFVVGWIFQGIGHWAFEKKSPAFFKNFEHLLIGPLWIFAKCIFPSSSPKAE